MPPGSIERIIAATLMLAVAAVAAAGFGSGWIASAIYVVGGVAALATIAWPLFSGEWSAQPPETPSGEMRTDGQSIMADAITDPVMIIGRGRVLQANSAALKLLGDHIAQEDIRVAIRHQGAIAFLESEAARAGSASTEILGLTGRDRLWELRAAPIGEGRQIVHLVDRSANRAAEQMRADFVANASHELRTPLAAILGFVETLEDDSAGADKETRQKFLGTMGREAKRMQQLVEDLMSLSRIEADKHRVPDEAVDLIAVTNEAIGAARDKPDAKARTIELTAPDSLPPLTGDRGQIGQLIANLVGNAIKYGRPGTPVLVKLEPMRRNIVRISVTDEGDGIPPEHIPRLTERFYRVDSGRSRQMGGTGLGLAIVKHIVERHRGRLEITSKMGVGTTVTVRLPTGSESLS